MSNIIVGSVGVRLVPDATGFPEKARSLTQGLTANVRLEADTKEASARMDEAAHERTATIDANADTGAANAKLDRAARTRKSTILPDVSGFGLLGTAALGLGPSLIPLAGVAAGLTAALGAPLAAAGGGATLYGLIAGKAVTSTEKQSKAIDQLGKKVLTAQQALAKASTPAGKKSAMATLTTDTKNYQDALHALSPAQAKFITAQGDLKASFARLEGTAGPAIFGPLVKGMDDLSTILPKLTPVLNPVSKAIGGLLDEVDRSAQHGTLNQFLGFLHEASGPTITNAGHILGNVAVGFGAIGSAFAPVGSSVTHGLVGWSHGFADIGRSKGLHDFVGYVDREGPVVARTLGDVGSATGHIVRALAPIGDVGLKVIDGLAKGVNKIPTRDLTIAAAAFAGIAVGLKGIGLANKGLGLLSKIPGVNIGRGGSNPLTGGIASRAEPVPVFVTNQGFGGAGVGGGGGGLGTAEEVAGGAAGASWLSRALGIGSKALGPIGLGITVGTVANSLGLNPYDHEGGPRPIPANDPRMIAWQKTLDAEGRRMLASLDILPAVKIITAGIGKQFATLPKAVQTKILTPGATDSVASVEKLIKTYKLTPPQKQTLFKVLGATEGTATVRALKSAIDGLHDKTVTINTVRHDSFASKVRGIAGARATGGPVGAGLPYLVGETSPEIFTPAVSGRIDPIHAGGNMGGRGAPLHGARLRLVVGDAEFDAYVDARADDRVDASAGLAAQTARAR